jgi:AcrR family transcriptional regulator
MSISSVAKAAGVSKPTIYRRFATKADLATAALVQRIDETARPPAALDVETALTRALEHLAQRLRTRNSMALVGTLLVEEDQTPELIALFRERVWTLRTELLREILERGQAREEIRNDVDAAVLVGMLIGALYAVHLGQGKIPRGWPARVVSTALEGARKPNASQ